MNKKTDFVDAKELAQMAQLDSVPESYVPTEESGKPAHLCAGDRSMHENRTEYANKIHELLSDHGITQEIKFLSVSG